MLEIERVFSARAALTAEPSLQLETLLGAAEPSQPSEADTGVREQITTQGHTVGKATL